MCGKLGSFLYFGFTKNRTKRFISILRKKCLDFEFQLLILIHATQFCLFFVYFKPSVRLIISQSCLSPGPDNHPVPLTTVDIELFYRLTSEAHLRTTRVNLETEI